MQKYTNVERTRAFESINRPVVANNADLIHLGNCLTSYAIDNKCILRMIAELGGISEISTYEYIEYAKQYRFTEKPYYSALKLHLPCFTASNESDNRNELIYNEYIGIDIDCKDKDVAFGISEELKGVAGVLGAYFTMSGDSFFCMLRVPQPNGEIEFENSFNAVYAYFINVFGIKIDRKSRSAKAFQSCLSSVIWEDFDNANYFDLSHKLDAVERQTPISNELSNDLNNCLNAIYKLDLAEFWADKTYDDYLKLVASFINTFGCESIEVIHCLCDGEPRYNENALNYKIKAILRDKEQNKAKNTIGTFWHYITEYKNNL